MRNIEILKKANIDVDKGIELLGDIEMYDETLQDFLDESKDWMERIQKSLEEGNMESYAIDVHAMKGDANYLGVTKLAELSLNLQFKSLDNDIKYVKSHYEELMKEASLIIKTVKLYLND